jgi:hypothetical protein
VIQSFLSKYMSTTSLIDVNAVVVVRHSCSWKLKAKPADPNTEHQFNAYQIKTRKLPFQQRVIFHLYSFLYSTGDLKVPFKIHDEYNIGNWCHWWSCWCSCCFVVSETFWITNNKKLSCSRPDPTHRWSASNTHHVHEIHFIWKCRRRPTLKHVLLLSWWTWPSPL